LALGPGLLTVPSTEYHMCIHIFTTEYINRVNVQLCCALYVNSTVSWWCIHLFTGNHFNVRNMSSDGIPISQVTILMYETCHQTVYQ